ncbi:MAG: DUF362 domain-containing protein [Desulfotomaculales bacterium]
MAKPVVAVVSFREPCENALREALDLCGGLKGFKSDERILIKPNLVGWDLELPVPPFGLVVTSAVIFALVKILAEEGFRKITIGEGPLMIPQTMGRYMFKILGYEELKNRYGVELVDFNEEKFEPVDFGGFKLSVAKKALEADKIINLPVLKTHNQTKVSLGFKNLKGCLDRKSKMFCHGKTEADLAQTFPLVADRLPIALTIIDGVFVLERGPSYTGKAYRKDLLIASQDPYACDVVGAEIMGYRVEDVPHLKFYADLHGRSYDLAGIEVRGEDVEKHRQFVAYDFEWTPENTGPEGFKKRGITGLAVRKYDNTLCTGCSVSFTPMIILLMSAFTGQPFPGVEILSGKIQTASPGFEKTVLFGNCACRANKDNPNIKKAIEVKGCPPKLEDFIKALREEGIDCRMEEYVKYRHYLYDRYKGKEGFDFGLYQARNG